MALRPWQAAVGNACVWCRPRAACFENTVEALYKYVVPKPKSQCSKTEQLGVSFAAGYIAGVFCAVVSHPADNLVSKLNSQKGATIGSIVNEMGWRAPPAMPCGGGFCPAWYPDWLFMGLVSPSIYLPLHFRLWLYTFTAWNDCLVVVKLPAALSCPPGMSVELRVDSAS